MWETTMREVSTTEALHPYFSDFPVGVIFNFMWTLSQPSCEDLYDPQLVRGH